MKGAIVVAAGLMVVCTAGAGTAPQPVGRYLFPSRGLVTQFERRGASWGYVWGEVIQQFHNSDPVVGSTVEAEVKRQLDQMRAIGVNEINYQLRTADPVAEPEFKPPDCNQPPVQGLQWPQPTPMELANLGDFFDLVHSEGMQIVLELVNTHMEEQPPTDSERWLGSILSVVKDKSALDLVQFDGTPHLLDTNGDGVYESCGVPAEAPLALGPASVVAQYVRWAIGYGLSLGILPSKLTAEAQVGWDFWDSHQPTPFVPKATDGHWWAPIETMKAIFDQLNIPADERTYSLSFYEHRRCTPAFTGSPNCVDESPHAWADESLRRVRNTVGPEPRLFAGEFGAATPVNPAWPTEAAVESLSVLMQRYHVSGGAYWQWVNNQDADDYNPQLADAVKRRGMAFIYNPIRLQLLDMYGFHLSSIENGSFERQNRKGQPDGWTIVGNGRATLRPFAGAQSYPWRGQRVLRLATRTAIEATSTPIRVSANTTYTTTGEFRTRTRSASVSFRFLNCQGRPLALRGQRSFLLPVSDTFEASPLRYTTPANACLVRIRISVRHGFIEADNIH